MLKIQIESIHHAVFDERTKSVIVELVPDKAGIQSHHHG